MNIYLAGKIRKNDWRQAVVLGLPHWESLLSYDVDSLNTLSEWPTWDEAVFDTFDYVGPYFISCDHGCYHGRSEHGYGASNSGCESSGSYTQSQVLTLCMKAIQNCDVFFAWIETVDCYGTIAEIGYAHGINKDIWIASPRRIEDMWLAYGMATRTSFDYKNPIHALEYMLGLKVEYYEYIRSEVWRQKADAAKARAHDRCQVCYKHRNEITLDAHHRTYARLGREHPEDITVLCRDCHELFERNRRLPKQK